MASSTYKGCPEHFHETGWIGLISGRHPFFQTENFPALLQKGQNIKNAGQTFKIFGLVFCPFSKMIQVGLELLDSGLYLAFKKKGPTGKTAQKR